MTTEQIVRNDHVRLADVARAARQRKDRVSHRDEFGAHRARPFLVDRDDIVDVAALLGGRGGRAWELCG